MNKSLIFIPTTTKKQHYIENVINTKNTWIKNLNLDLFDYFFVYETDSDTYIENNNIYLKKTLDFGLKKKTQEIIRFFQTYKTQYKYLIKCDDDTYVDTDWLSSFVQTCTADLFGYLGVTDKFNKDKTSFIWPHGSFYGLSNNAYNYIINESDKLGDIIHFYFEDIWIGYSLQDKKYTKLAINNEFYNGYNYHYIKNLNSISNKKIIHIKNTSLYNSLYNSSFSKIFDIYHSIVQLSGNLLSSISNIDQDQNCFNISFNPSVYINNKTETEYSGAYLDWMKNRSTKNCIYNINGHNAFSKNITYFDQVPELSFIKKMVKNNSYNNIFVLPQKPDWHIPFNIIVLINDQIGYEKKLEEIVKSTCCELNIVKI